MLLGVAVLLRHVLEERQMQVRRAKRAQGHPCNPIYFIFIHEAYSSMASAPRKLGHRTRLVAQARHVHSHVLGQVAEEHSFPCLGLNGCNLLSSGVKPNRHTFKVPRLAVTHATGGIPARPKVLRAGGASDCSTTCFDSQQSLQGHSGGPRPTNERHDAVGYPLPRKRHLRGARVLRGPFRALSAQQSQRKRRAPPRHGQTSRRRRGSGHQVHLDGRRGANMPRTPVPAGHAERGVHIMGGSHPQRIGRCW